jgi:hypothetical protein
MSILKPRPIIPLLIKPIVPAWVLVAVIATQIVIMNVGDRNEATCELLFQRPHYSTSLQEKVKIDAVKLNITSSCTANQLHTDLVATISSISGGEIKILNKSGVIRQDASKDDPTRAHFLEFWAPCKRGGVVKYIGNAYGEVTLRSGEVVPVSDSMDKSLAVLCQPRAK